MYDHELSGSLGLDPVDDLFDIPDSQFNQEGSHFFGHASPHGHMGGFDGSQSTASAVHQEEPSPVHFEQAQQQSTERGGSMPGIPGVSPKDLFYSPMLGVGTQSTPMMNPPDPNDQRNFQADFEIPPSYFSPTIAAMGVSRPDLGKSRRRSTSSSCLAKKSPQVLPRRRRANGLAAQSIGPSAVQLVATGGSSGDSPHSHSATPSPHRDDAHVEISDLHMPPPAATPARLMNLSASSDRRRTAEPNDNIEERLDMAISATATQHMRQMSGTSSVSPSTTPSTTPRMRSDTRRFSNASQSSLPSSSTPAILPRLAHQSSRNSSVSSSPALHPNMSSPTLSPRGGDMIGLLASKSNYQNVIEGNHHQLGLQYPEKLASNLTTKKANHKIAEQERRNRINSAIVELGRLVSPEQPTTSNSKAGTVEGAITYIRTLQGKIHELEKKLQSSEVKKER